METFDLEYHRYVKVDKILSYKVEAETKEEAVRKLEQVLADNPIDDKYFFECDYNWETERELDDEEAIPVIREYGSDTDLKTESEYKYLYIFDYTTGIPHCINLDYETSLFIRNHSIEEYLTSKKFELDNIYYMLTNKTINND